jgi:protein-tyrosine-phosphatase
MAKQHVLFLCPHAAAKSVLAMTYFKDLASKAQLDISTDNAGTEPDPVINPTVDAYLKAEGWVLTGFTPTLLTDKHLESADIVVSMGCILPNQVPDGVRYIDWSDVPLLSDGFQIARDRIYQNVEALVAQLIG